MHADVPGRLGPLSRFITSATTEEDIATAKERLSPLPLLPQRKRWPSRSRVQVADEITSHGAQAMTLAVDVSDRAAVTDAIGSLTGEWADVDILVNNGR